MSLKKYEKIINDVNAIYSYILTESEIKKLSDNIFKLVNYTLINYIKMCNV